MLEPILKLGHGWEGIKALHRSQYLPKIGVKASNRRRIDIDTGTSPVMVL